MSITIWIACEPCYVGNKKRALFFGSKPEKNEETGQWDSWNTIGLQDDTKLPIKIGELKAFKLVEK